MASGIEKVCRTKELYMQTTARIFNENNQL